ncbi:unnamed protein product [Adineta ricciae]|uniref:G-protein coupled receptors family 1 profile domain-containing protein n=1 Tax=Adineta ricciae TaxID=249248 RepID=A0A814HYR8_ADIRI|nr:unnamed protein product [Adineta ricciae]CAF1027374.1 unnamed protein product [Adineta ricciae]
MSCNNSTNIFLLGLVSGITSDIRAQSIDQQALMTFAYVFSITSLSLFGLVSNILSVDTLCQAQIRSTTVGIYLIAYSCCSIIGIIMLECRLIRMLENLNYAGSLIICSIVSSIASIFTRICLWLNGLVSLQRSLQSFEATVFMNKIRSQSAAFKQIVLVFICIPLMHVHEIISRVSLPDPLLLGNYICQIRYSPPLLTMNTVFAFIHLFVPFTMNMLSNCLILTSITRRRVTLHHRRYWIEWKHHFRRHCHLFLSPTCSLICITPQLILTLKFSCVNISLKWLLRLNTAANLIIYIPQAATFFLFVYPSETYYDVFRTQSDLKKCFRPRPQNSVHPVQTVADQIETVLQPRNQS